MIRQLPAGTALVIRGGNAPVIARLPRAWNNPAYRLARHRTRLPVPPCPGPLTTATGKTSPARAPHLIPGPGRPGDPRRPAAGPEPPAPGWSPAISPNGPSSPWSQP